VDVTWLVIDFVSNGDLTRVGFPGERGMIDGSSYPAGDITD
jgi:hypothetical protein